MNKEEAIKHMDELGLELDNVAADYFTVTAMNMIIVTFIDWLYDNGMRIVDITLPENYIEDEMKRRRH